MYRSKNIDLGVLFVHGIGNQRRGETLVSWGDSLVECIEKFGRDETCTNIQFGDVVLGSPGVESPAHAKLTIGAQGSKGKYCKTWLMTESCWAETFCPPTYTELLRWSFLVLPWAMVSHFTLRLLRVNRKPLRGLLLFFIVLFAMAIMPVILTALCFMLLLGLIPVPAIRSLAGSVQRTLASSIGDSLVLLGSPTREGAIIARVHRDLAWLSTQCKRIAVVAHSQGAAVTHEVLKKDPPTNVKLFVSFGSGIRKLHETRRMMKGGGVSGLVPWLLSLGATMFLVSVWFSLPAVWAVRHWVGWTFLAYAIAMLVDRNI